MSSNNQVLIRKVGSQWWGWYDGCVDNEFDFSIEPDWKASSKKKLYYAINDYLNKNDMCLEYGINKVDSVIHKIQLIEESGV